MIQLKFIIFCVLIWNEADVSNKQRSTTRLKFISTDWKL